MAKKRIQKEIKDKILKYIEILKEDGLDIQEVYLFGSYARGTQNQYSDIDVCVISEEFKNQSDAISYLNQYEFRGQKLIDIEGHGFNKETFYNSYLSLPYQIKREGIKVC